MKTTTEMKLIPIGELIPYINNARTHSPEQINKLRASLREFGFINPVIIDKDMNIIADGTTQFDRFSGFLCFQVSVNVHRNIRLRQVFSMKPSAGDRITHVRAELAVGRAGIDIGTARPFPNGVENNLSVFTFPSGDAF